MDKNSILMGCTCGKIKIDTTVTIYYETLQKNEPNIRISTVEFRCRNCGTKFLIKADRVEIK